MKDIFSYPFDIPIFATQKFDLGGTPLLVVGGGGGDSKTGVKNKLTVFELAGEFGSRRYTFDFGGSAPTGLSYSGDLLAVLLDNHCAIVKVSKDPESLCKFEILQKVFPEPGETETKKDKLSLVRSVSFTPDNEHYPVQKLAFGVANGTLSIFDCVKGDHYNRRHSFKPFENYGDNLAVMYLDWNPGRNILMAVCEKIITFISFETEEGFKQIDYDFSRHMKDYKVHSCKWLDKSRVLISYILPRKQSYLVLLSFSETKAMTFVTEPFQVYRDQHHTCMKLSPCRNFAVLGSPKGAVEVVRICDKDEVVPSFKRHMAAQMHSFILSDVQFLESKSKESASQLQLVTSSFDGTLTVRSVVQQADMRFYYVLLVLLIAIILGYFFRS